MSYDTKYGQAYRDANRELLREKARERYREKREEILEYQKRYAQERPEVGKAWKAAHRDRIASYNRKRLYGLTEEQYQVQLRRQGGICALCRKPETAKGGFTRLGVDHDHSTGRPRGLLCISCNISIGCFERGLKTKKLDPELARRYLSGYYWQGV
jgi:hypothetical protein